MAIFKLPPGSSLVDGQIVQVSGPDAITKGFQYDSNTKTFYTKGGQVVIPSSHGSTHISEDPIPDASQKLPGLMSSDDKVKLDTMLQQRIGVLGFQGAGFPDDGGWMQGDVILAAGSEFISLERLGNVIRFTVDSPLPLNCGCEECAQIFWIQDETDSASIRPPSCAGKLPGINSYGEVKFYLMPESTIVDPSNPTPTLNLKGNQPSLIFKRYDDGILPGQGEFEMVLKRRSSGVTEVGWSMTPGPLGVPECVWHMGSDDQGNEIRFELSGNSEPGLLGALLYKGHTLTRQMGVITGFDSTVTSTNCYKIRNWDIEGEVPVGEEYNAINLWKYDNPENSAGASVNAKKLTQDVNIDLLEVGTLVQLWGFQIAEVSGERIYNWYFNLKPSFNVSHAFVPTGHLRFGDLLIARDEISGPGISELTAHTVDVSDIRTFERSVWGITGFEDRLILADDGLEVDSSGGDATFTGEPSGETINNEFVADIDPALPGLRVYRTDPDTYAERPINIWHRTNHGNLYAKMLLGRPDASTFPPYDILLGAPIDSLDDLYIKVIRRGRFSTGPFAGQYYVVVKGSSWKDIPQSGTLRVLTGTFRNNLWKYYYKAAFSPWDDDSTVLIGFDEIYPFDDDINVGSSGTDLEEAFVDVATTTSVSQILHADYTSPALRVEFSVNQTPGEEVVQTQFKVGQLDMSTQYELEDEITPQTVEDNLVRGMQPGYATSQIYTQVGFVNEASDIVMSDPDGFVIYDGGTFVDSGGDVIEQWNELELLWKDNQLYVWWNGYLITPSTADSAALSTPVAVNTPYFPLTSRIGKFGTRLWPGATVREIKVADQAFHCNEFKYGQLEISDGSGSSSSSSSGSGSE